MTGWTAKALYPLLLALPVLAGAKCATGIVIVEGKVAMTAEEPVSLSIGLQTPHGSYERTAAVQSSFKVEAPFSTFSSYSPLWGHRCTNLPTVVEIAAHAGGKQLGELKIKFKGNAIPCGLAGYCLRSKAVIDSAGVRLEGP